MVEFIAECPQCQGNMKASTGQICRPEALHWYRSESCTRCARRIEYDDTGIDLPLQQMLIKADGLWELLLPPMQRSAKAYQVIRALLSLSMAETVAFKQNESGVVHRGTRQEVEFYRNQARKQGLELVMVQIAPASDDVEQAGLTRQQ
jgi:hypothetical protein